MIEEKADIVVSTYKTFNTNTGLLEYHAYQKDCAESVFNQKDLLLALPSLDRDSSFSYPFGKLVSRIALGKIRFNESTQLGEDMEFWYKVYLKVNKVIFVNRDTYTYRIHSTSAANNLTVEKLKSSMQHRLDFIAILAARGINIESYVQDYIRHLYDVMAVIENQGLEADETLRWIREMMYLLTFKNEE